MASRSRPAVACSEIASASRSATCATSSGLAILNKQVLLPAFQLIVNLVREQREPEAVAEQRRQSPQWVVADSVTT